MFFFNAAFRSVFHHGAKHISFCFKLKDFCMEKNYQIIKNIIVYSLKFFFNTFIIHNQILLNISFSPLFKTSIRSLV